MNLFKHIAPSSNSAVGLCIFGTGGSPILNHWWIFIIDQFMFCICVFASFSWTLHVLWLLKTSCTDTVMNRVEWTTWCLPACRRCFTVSFCLFFTVWVQSKFCGCFQLIHFQVAFQFSQLYCFFHSFKLTAFQRHILIFTDDPSEKITFIMFYKDYSCVICILNEWANEWIS